MNPDYGGSIEIRETGSGEEVNYEVGEAESAEACRDCQVGPENEDLVRRYFKKLTET